MDELSNYLMSNKSHAKLSPESLEMMGKQAANMFLGNEDVTLNDAVAKIAGEHHDISNEQIKRVVEFANTAVYLAKHDQAKTAGSEHSYPQFELADAGRVIQDLSDGARPTVVTKTDIDYNRLAKKEKVSSPQTEQAFETLFKSASTEDYVSNEAVAHQLLEAKEALIGLRGVLSDRYNQYFGLFKEATADLYKSVKEHLLEGGTFDEVQAAIGCIEPNKEKLSSVMHPIVVQLITERVAHPEDLKKQAAATSEHDERFVDTDHPILKNYGATKHAFDELSVTHEAMKQTDTEFEHVQSFIKKAFFDKEALGGLLASLPMVGRMAGAVTRGRGLLGGAAKAVGNFVKKDPIGAASMAASATALVPQRQPAPVPPTNIG